VGRPVGHGGEQGAAAIGVVVHMARLRGGRRVVFQVSTVEGRGAREAEVTEIFAFRPRSGSTGEFVATGRMPSFARMLEDRGEHLPEVLFTEGPDSAATSVSPAGAAP